MPGALTDRSRWDSGRCTYRETSPGQAVPVQITISAGIASQRLVPEEDGDLLRRAADEAL